jgi:hypothetical protein|uniref:hypothetical protein n=1 Tax=Prevotella sp. TaxID=59823 RepID=UPI00402541AD
MIDITQHTLKGQKLCKLSGFLKLLPLQGALFVSPQNLLILAKKQPKYLEVTKFQSIFAKE